VPTAPGLIAVLFNGNASYSSAGTTNPNTELVTMTVSGGTVIESAPASLGEILGSLLAISPDGTRILAGGIDLANEYQVDDLSLIRSISYSTPNSPRGQPTTGTVTSLAFSADGADFAVTGAFTDLRSESSPAGTEVLTYRDDTGQVIRTYDWRTTSANSGIPIAVSERLMTWLSAALVIVTYAPWSSVPEVEFLRDAAQSPATLTLTGPTTDSRNQPITLAGTVMSPAASLGGRIVSLTISNMDGSKSLGTVVTDSSGRFTFASTPNIGGTNVYTAAVDADATHAAGSTTFSVVVSRQSAGLTLSTDHSTYTYHSTVHVTAHLGASYKNHSVTIYETPYGGSKTTLRTATIDSHGDVTTSFLGSVSTTVSVSYFGDEIYAPRTITTLIKVAAWISTELAGYYKTSGSYHIFHQADGGAMGATIHPDAAVKDRHVWFITQVDKDGKWESAISPLEQFTSSTGFASIGFDGKTGYGFRTEVVFYGDGANAGYTSAWNYFQFTS
jgi:hypothetical protein